jgi:hypothetical protein
VYDDVAGTQDVVFPDGRIERIETDATGRPVRRILLAPGRLPGVAGEMIASFAYAGAARMAAITYGNRVTTSFAVDEALRPIRIDHALEHRSR